MCECVPGKNIICIEKVPPKDKCPLTCDGHTPMDAAAFPLNECVSQGSGPFYKVVVDSGNPGLTFYSDSKCTTTMDMSGTSYEFLANTLDSPGCTPENQYINVPESDLSGSMSGSTALKVTLPALFVVGLLAFVLI